MSLSFFMANAGHLVATHRAVSRTAFHDGTASLTTTLLRHLLLVLKMTMIDSIYLDNYLTHEAEVVTI